MSWVRLDDQFFMHPKVLPLSRGAKLLYLSGLTFASAQLTDGHLTNAAVGQVARTVGVPPRLAVDLAAAGLWTATEDGYVIHDYLTYNPSREHVLETRQKATDRIARWRERKAGSNAVGNGVTSPLVTLPTSHVPSHVPMDSALPSSDVESASNGALAAARKRRSAIGAEVRRVRGQ